MTTTHAFAVGQKYRLVNKEGDYVFASSVEIGDVAEIISNNRSGVTLRFDRLQLNQSANPNAGHMHCMQLINDNYTERLRTALAAFSQRKRTWRDGWKPTVGDIVKVRKYADLVDEFGDSNRGYLMCGDDEFTDDVKNYCGNIYQVEGVRACGCKLQGMLWNWTPEMLEPA